METQLRPLTPCDLCQTISFTLYFYNYRKIPKISPGAYIFQQALLEGLIFGGAYIRRVLCTEGLG